MQYRAQESVRPRAAYRGGLALIVLFFLAATIGLVWASGRGDGPAPEDAILDAGWFASS